MVGKKSVHEIFGCPDPDFACFASLRKCLGVGGACFRRKIWCSPTRLASVYSVVPRVPLACARFWRCKLRVSEKVKNDELRERYEWAWILGETG